MLCLEPGKARVSDALLKMAVLAAWVGGVGFGLIYPRRYYQAWLEGGGGAIPAVVAEEHSGDDDAGDDHDNDNGNDDVGANDGRGNEKEAALPPPDCLVDAPPAAVTSAEGKKVAGGSDAAAAGGRYSEEEGGLGQSESEAELLGLDRVVPKPSFGVKKRSKLEAAAAAAVKVSGDANIASPGFEGEEAMMMFGDDGCHVHFESSLREEVLLGAGDTGGKEEESKVVGRRAKRLLRKQARKDNRLLLGAAAAGNNAAAGGVAAVKGSKGRRGVKGKGQGSCSSPRGGSKNSAAAAAAKKGELGCAAGRIIWLIRRGYALSWTTSRMDRPSFHSLLLQ